MASAIVVRQMARLDPTRFTHLETSSILLQSSATAQTVSFWFRTYRAAEQAAVTHRLEQQQSAQDDHRSGFAIIYSPASQPGTNPGAISQRSTFVRVLLPCGAAFQRGANRLQGRSISRVEHVLERPACGSVTISHQLHHLYCRDQYGSGKI